MDGNINTRMHADLDPNNADGTKVVAYYVDEDKDSKDYIPLAYQTGNPGEVGAILRITKEPVSRMYSGIEVTANCILVELVACGTGEVIDSNSFTPMWSSRLKSGDVPVVDQDRVKDWVQEQWDAYLAENK